MDHTLPNPSCPARPGDPERRFWLMTTAASTDNKLQGANVVMGDGKSYAGVASAPYSPVASSARPDVPAQAASMMVVATHPIAVVVRTIRAR